MPAENSQEKSKKSRVDLIIDRLKNHKIISLLIVAAIVISGIAGFMDSISKIANIVSSSNGEPSPRAKNAPASLLKNGGFEEGYLFWGSGYYETEVYRGALPPFWASFILNNPKSRDVAVAKVSGNIATDVKRSGNSSLHIVNDITPKSHIYGSISQRITNLEPNTEYVAEFWVKADRSKPGALQLTTDLEWKHRTSIPGGTYDWTLVRHIFSTHNKTFIDFRFVSDQPGTVWVDDVRLDRHFANE